MSLLNNKHSHGFNVGLLMLLSTMNVEVVCLSGSDLGEQLAPGSLTWSIWSTGRFLSFFKAVNLKPPFAHIPGKLKHNSRSGRFPLNPTRGNHTWPLAHGSKPCVPQKKLNLRCA